MKTFSNVLLILSLPASCLAETVLLKDGAKFEAIKITEDSDRLSIQTKYGNFFADKADVENLEALGFADTPAARGPESLGLEFISELAPDSSIKVEYYFKKEKIATQYYTQAGELLRSSGQIRDGAYKEFYADGKVKKEKTVIDGQNNGYFKTFFPDGTLMSEAYFINGKMNGGHKVYSDSGKLLMERNYINGIANGYFRDFDESGAIKSQTQYVNGTPNHAAETPRAALPLDQEYEPARSEAKTGRSQKANSFFLEGEVFSVGGADKEWKKNYDDAVAALSSVFQSATGDMTSYPGLGATAGVTLGAYKKSAGYLALSYVKGPSADIEINLSDPGWGSGTYTEELTTSFYRLLLGYKFTFPREGGNFFTIDANGGFGGGTIKSEWSSYVSGAGADKGSATESWTGFTWSVGPAFSWEYPGYIVELGARYTAFPALKDGDKFSDIQWRPFSVKASILF